MKQTLEVLNTLIAEGIVDRYAIGGAVAAYNYVEATATATATATEDLDVNGRPVLELCPVR
ncbi:hypothetical protein [Methylobacterium segetis]|uniref:hypothetical protein n=1 Tax=Methylobacterium segetis TaxID=2488750 RepID=UPI001050CD4E|nr:hypothetical protein [Methylobacterium segetis]